MYNDLLLKSKLLLSKILLSKILLSKMLLRKPRVVASNTLRFGDNIIQRFNYEIFNYFAYL